MSDRMTSIVLPRAGNPGIADWGRRTAPEMIAQIRVYAAQQKLEAEAILAASDDQFHVTTYVGVHVQRNKEIVQRSSIEKP